MRTADATTQAFLDTTTATRPWANLVTVYDLRDGGSDLRWTDYAADLLVGGDTFEAGGQGTAAPIVTVSGRREYAGISDIGRCSVSLFCGNGAAVSRPNGTMRVSVFAARRGFDGAKIKIERIFMRTPGDVGMDPVHYFEGIVGQVRPTGTVVEMDVESGVAALNVMLPRHVFQPGCAHIVYDSGCGLSRATFTDTWTVGTGATTTVIPSDSIRATGTTNSLGWYALGVLAFAGDTTTAALRNVSRRVQSYSTTDGTFTLDRALSVAPADTDTFTVYPGCPKTVAACSNSNAASGPAFNNLTKFRGEPFTPRNEAAL